MILTLKKLYDLLNPYKKYSNWHTKAMHRVSSTVRGWHWGPQMTSAWDNISAGPWQRPPELRCDIWSREFQCLRPFPMLRSLKPCTMVPMQVAKAQALMRCESIQRESLWMLSIEVKAQAGTTALALHQALLLLHCSRSWPQVQGLQRPPWQPGTGT